MGYLKYGREEIPFEDRTAAHLEIVFSAKLRRAEHFFLNWRVSPALGSGRHSIWIDNGVPMHFTFSGSVIGAINRAWLDQLMLSAATPLGMDVGDEPLDAH
ncbi:hypothetical protein [Conyzicola sp.]|uniref:DUF7882 family protein n=1 Tax=Conyzicola sp. TaxID=1969404 RepID=UPI0039893B89